MGPLVLGLVSVGLCVLIFAWFFWYAARDRESGAIDVMTPWPIQLARAISKIVRGRKK